MKYRRLNTDELDELTREFIQFLAANTVTGPEWVKLKQEDPAKAEGLIDIFSDTVFDKIIAEIQYMEYKTPEDIKTFHCHADKIVLNGLRVEGGDGQVDLTKNLPPQELMQSVHQAGAKMQVYSAEKIYRPDREQELFRMLEGGALIDREGKLFQAIEGLKS